MIVFCLTQSANYWIYCKLNILPRIKLFAWKLIRGKIPTRDFLSNIGINININCSFCLNNKEDSDHLFKDYEFIQQIWKTISEFCPNPLELICGLLTGLSTFGIINRIIIGGMGIPWKTFFLYSLGYIEL